MRLIVQVGPVDPTRCYILDVTLMRWVDRQVFLEWPNERVVTWIGGSNFLGAVYWLKNL